jgi:hypothetical protein
MPPVAPPPPSWAIREEDGKTEYVLCLFAPTAEDAERMAREEADRFVVEFAEEIAAWIQSGPHGSPSEARREWDRRTERRILRVLPDDDDGNEVAFEIWQAEQILRMAKRERSIP